MRGGERRGEFEDLGNISLFGIGLKHSISQYLPPGFPSISPRASSGSRSRSARTRRATSSSHRTRSRSASRRARSSRRSSSPTRGSRTIRIRWTSPTRARRPGRPVRSTSISRRTSTLHLTLGLMLKSPGVKVFGEYNIASQSSFAFGVGLRHLIEKASLDKEREIYESGNENMRLSSLLFGPSQVAGSCIMEDRFVEFVVNEKTCAEFSKIDTTVSSHTGDGRLRCRDLTRFWTTTTFPARIS